MKDGAQNTPYFFIFEGAQAPTTIAPSSTFGLCTATWEALL